MEYCKKKTLEQCQKDSADMTRKELDKLTHLLKNNPQLLNPRSEEPEEDYDLDEQSERAERVERTEQRDYYLTLELNTKMAEIADLQKENALLRKKADLFQIIQQVVAFYEETRQLQDYKKSTVLREITSSITEVTNVYERKIGKINVLRRHLLVGLKDFNDSSETINFLNHYNTSLVKLQDRLRIYYERNINALEQCVRSKHFYFHLQCFAATSLIILFIFGLTLLSANTVITTDLTPF
jgi:hypothetical protein